MQVEQLMTWPGLPLMWKNDRRKLPVLVPASDK